MLFREPPVYRVVSEIGPDHAKSFVTEIAVGGKVLARRGRSKKQSEQEAAKKALVELQKAIRRACEVILTFQQIWGQGNDMLHLSTDVLIVGAGGAGMYAAVAAARNGASVILLDKSLVGRGGATVMAQMTVAAALGQQEPDHWDHPSRRHTQGRPRSL